MILRPISLADLDGFVAFTRQAFEGAFGHLYSPRDLAAFFGHCCGSVAFGALSDMTDVEAARGLEFSTLDQVIHTAVAGGGLAVIDRQMIEKELAKMYADKT